jgi:excisionase family DNA binding protein
MSDIPMPMPDHLRTKPWLDAEEAALFLSTTAHTLRRLAREGRCPVLVRRIGGRWRFSRLDIERFVTGDDHHPAA